VERSGAPLISPPEVEAEMATRRSVLSLGVAAEMVLLGESIFDNAAYVRPGDEVIAQLGCLLPQGWTATPLAEDGAVLAGVLDQLKRVPSTASQLVVSAGGNDALRASGFLRQSARSVADALTQIANIRTMPMPSSRPVPVG
jgi:hypothetical protein